MVFAELKHAVRCKREDYELEAPLGDDRFFSSVNEAIEAYRAEIGGQWQAQRTSHEATTNAGPGTHGYPAGVDRTCTRRGTVVPVGSPARPEHAESQVVADRPDPGRRGQLRSNRNTSTRFRGDRQGRTRRFSVTDHGIGDLGPGRGLPRRTIIGS